MYNAKGAGSPLRPSHKKQDANCVLFLFSLTTEHAQQESGSRILPATL
jgi:hypothetical protein